MRTFLVALLLAASACAGAPASTSTSGSGADAAVTDPARLYRAKCSACHRPYEPASRTRAQWGAVMVRMARKAHLSAPEEQALRGFLDAGASDAVAGGTAR